MIPAPVSRIQNRPLWLKKDIETWIELINQETRGPGDTSEGYI